MALRRTALDLLRGRELDPSTVRGSSWDEKFQGQCCLLGDDSVAEHLEFLGWAESVAGDPALRKAHHPFHECGR